MLRPEPHQLHALPHSELSAAAWIDVRWPASGNAMWQKVVPGSGHHVTPLVILPALAHLLAVVERVARVDCAHCISYCAEGQQTGFGAVGRRWELGEDFA